MAKIKCGECKGRHETVAAVRDCYAEAAYWRQAEETAAAEYAIESAIDAAYGDCGVSKHLYFTPEEGGYAELY